MSSSGDPTDGGDLRIKTASEGSPTCIKDDLVYCGQTLFLVRNHLGMFI
uniref:Uncharacterized protein n=1 Tax=Heterorhabditis bacteriophora TaxID=37862 RepID=A0A1I7WFM8_HETBA